MVVRSPSSGLTAVINVLAPGDLFGLIPALDLKPHIATLEAVIEAQILTVPRETFLYELDRHPETARHLLGELAALARSGQEWLISQL